jgi:hypothetical protein
MNGKERLNRAYEVDFHVFTAVVPSQLMTMKKERRRRERSG